MQGMSKFLGPKKRTNVLVMTLLFTPVFYVVMQRLSGQRKKKPEKEPKISADAKPALQK